MITAISSTVLGTFGQATRVTAANCREVERHASRRSVALGRTCILGIGRVLCELDAWCELTGFADVIGRNKGRAPDEHYAAEALP